VNESATHPYKDTHEQVSAVDFPGASAIEVVFHPYTDVFLNDSIEFRSACGLYSYADFSGYSGPGSYPGVGAVPSLVIPGASVQVCFHSRNGTNPAFGYLLALQPSSKPATVADPVALAREAAEAARAEADRKAAADLALGTGFFFFFFFSVFFFCGSVASRASAPLSIG
jgi:hypothetical protein